MVAKASLISIPVAIFLILQSQGIGIFSIVSMLEPKNIQIPPNHVRTGLMMAQSGSNIYIAWIDNNVSHNVLFRMSKDAGKSFEPIINLNDNEGRSVTRSIASEGSAVHVAWIDDTNGNLDVLFRRSVDGGKTFDATVNLSNNHGNSEFVVLDAEGPAIYAVWIDDVYGNAEIFFRESQDAGLTFGSTLNLSNNQGSSEAPMVLSEGSNVYVVWHDDTEGNFDVLFRASYDNGKTFGHVMNLSSSKVNSGFAVLTASGPNVYVAWIEECMGKQEIFFRASNDGGITFGPTINLSNSKAKSTLPTIDVSGSLACVAWVDEGVEMMEELLVSCSMDGQSFKDTVRIANGNDLRSSVIDVEGIDVYVTWIDKGTAVNGMFIRTSNDAGSSFLPAVNITVGRIEDAIIDVEATNVYAIWSDKQCLDQECHSIKVNTYFMRSIDRGFTFEAPIKISK